MDLSPHLAMLTLQLGAGGGDVALAVLNLSGGGEAARATGRPAVEQYVLPCNRRSPERKLPRRWRALPARTPAARHPLLPHFRGPDLSLALVAKVGHPLLLLGVVYRRELLYVEADLRPVARQSHC
jgi:hypothetical protein